MKKHIDRFNAKIIINTEVDVLVIFEDKLEDILRVLKNQFEESLKDNELNFELSINHVASIPLETYRKSYDDDSYELFIRKNNRMSLVDQETFESLCGEEKSDE